MWNIALLQKDISKIQASEKKFLREVKGCSLREYLWNKERREVTAVSYTHLDVYKRQNLYTITI